MRLVNAARVLYLSGSEFRRDFCFERAASLTFATIISLIPLAVLFVSIAGRLGGGDSIIRFVEDQFFKFVAPEHQEDLAIWLKTYISKEAFSRSPTGVINILAVLGLFLAALGVFVTAERVFNRIWNVRGSRSFFQKATVFWVLLSTSPLLMLVSISVDGYVQQFTEAHELLKITYGFVVPFFIGFIGFSLFYIFLPSTRVRLTSAGWGGLSAALLWEISKHGFGVYVRRAATVTSFYEQIAAVPLFLIWLYVTWVIILWGGQISYAHQNLQSLRRAMGRRLFRGRSDSPAYLGTCFLALVGDAFSRGAQPPSVEWIAARLKAPEEVLARLAADLAEQGYVVEDPRTPGVFLPARAPDRILLRDLVGWLDSGSQMPELDEDLEAEGAAADRAVTGRVRRLFRESRRLSLSAFGELTLDAVIRDAEESEPPAAAACESPVARAGGSEVQREHRTARDPGGSSQKRRGSRRD